MNIGHLLNVLEPQENIKFPKLNLEQVDGFGTYPIFELIINKYA